MNFVPGKGSRINKKECVVIAAELVRIGEANKGLVTPEMIVQEARSKDSPLHDYFDWTEKVAAEKWRLFQAGQLLRSVDVVIELSAKPPIVTRAFISFGDAKGYHSVEAVMNDDALRKQLLAQAKSEMYALLKKYQDLEELSGVFEAIRQVAA